jgi:hypothetical protein
VASTKLYRVAEGTLLGDQDPEGDRAERREELIELFHEVLLASQRSDPDLSRLLRSDLSLGILSDIIAHALDLPATFKQQLLGETRDAERVESLIGRLRDHVRGRASPRRFPPPFSVN